MRYKNTNEELKEAVKNNLSLAGVLRALNIRAVGGNYKTTDTYRGKNLQSALSERREVEYRKFREALTGNADGNPEPSLTNNSKEGAETLHDKSKSKKPKIIRYCECCGKELTNRQMKYCSVKCYIESTKGRRPDIFTLLNDFKELHSVLQVSKKYGVSDNAVRHWCEFYGILDMIKRKSRPQTE